MTVRRGFGHFCVSGADRQLIGNGNAAKLDIREWHPNHERCGKGITLTEDEGRNLYAALKAIYEKE